MAVYLGKNEATPTLGDVRVNINNPFFEQKSDVSYVISPELFTPEIENILHHPIISALEKITVLTQSKYDEIKNANALNPNILYLIQEEVKMQTTSMLKKIVLLSQEKYDSYKNNNTLDENILYLTPNQDGEDEPKTGWIITNMNSNNSPLPLTASASSHLQAGSFGNFEPWRAFDGFPHPSSPPDSWASDTTFVGADGTGNEWLQLDFGKQTAVNAYAVTNRLRDSRPTHSFAPKDFTLQGSNDGINFSIIDTVTGRTADELGQRTEHLLTQAVNFRIYRLNITKVHVLFPSERRVCIGQLDFGLY
jgi:hypothetical protein